MFRPWEVRVNQSAVDVVVVGGGVIGCAAAYQLARDGYRVTLLEQFAIGHETGSSHGPSRIIRLAYDGADYVALARSSYAMWRELEAETGECLLVPTGGLDIGAPAAFALDGIRATFEATGVPFEQLDGDEIMRRFPQFTLPEGTIGLYQPDYSLLAANRCVAAIASRARMHGAVLREGERALDVHPEGDGVKVKTASGTIRADRIVLAAGSWLRPILRPLGIDIPITVLKEQLGFFPAIDPEPYCPGRLPLVIHRFPGTTSLGSVFPIFEHTGVKIMIDRIGPVVEPDDPDRSIDAPALERLRQYATGLLSGLTGEILEAVSCRYTMTPDEDFVLDRHPAHPQIVIASSCSGHGFKFAPVIGRILADLSVAGRTDHDVARFHLDRPALSAS
jgi:sarcosine oxidase